MVVLLLGGAPSGAETDVLELTPQEALLTAQAAYAAGNAEVANRIARALLLADAADPMALLILAGTETRLGQPKAGLQAGRKAWASAKARGLPKGLRYEIARNTALAAYAAGKPGLAQFWLRRSLDVAPSADMRAQSGKDLAFVRSNTPLHWKLSLGIGPSDNLNGGATDPLFRIDDQVIGGLGAGSLALSGTKAVLDLSAQYALPSDGAAQTVLGLSLTASRHRISPGDRVLAGKLISSDLDSTELGLTLRRDMTEGLFGNPMVLSATVGGSWAAGEWLGPSLAAEVSLPVHRSAGANLWMTTGLERRWSTGSGSGLDIYSLGFFGQTRLSGSPVAGSLSFQATAQASRGSSANSTYDALSLQLSYDPDWSPAGLDLTLRAGMGLRSYDVFSLGFANVTNGRQDESLSVGLDLSNPDWSIMGFAPVLSVSHGRTTSNVSRFETETTAVTLGIESVF